MHKHSSFIELLKFYSPNAPSIDKESTEEKDMLPAKIPHISDLKNSDLKTENKSFFL